MTVETKTDIKVPEISDNKIYLPVSSNTPKININNDIVLVNVEDEKIEK